VCRDRRPLRQSLQYRASEELANVRDGVHGEELVLGAKPCYGVDVESHGRFWRELARLVEVGVRAYLPHIPNIDTLWTDINLIVVSSDQLTHKISPHHSGVPYRTSFSIRIPPKDVSMTCTKLATVFSMNVSP
jgi:hypothetical protein